MKNKIIKAIRDAMKILALVLLVCFVYRLNIFSIILCLAAAVVFNVFFEKEEIKRQCYLDKFNDVVLYMEQMVYSFKKQPKIRDALYDAKKISSKKMKEAIEETVINIDVKETEKIYEDALNVIQRDYDCKRLNSLHKFLIKIEQHGGEYENYIDILLDDIKEWSDRVALFMKDVARVKRNVIISIFSTLVTCGFMVYLIPKEYRYTEHFIFQICSTTVIVLMLFIFLFINKRLNFDWLKEKKSLSENMIVKYYALVEKKSMNVPMSFIERLSYKKAKRTLEIEIKKAFPDWMREVAVNLQNDTVQSAIENSYDASAFVLKRPIRKLLIDFEKYPIGIEPYDNFLREFDLADIKSSIKMFYSINELGKEQWNGQVDSIIDRNNKMSRQAEEMKNRDKIGAVGMLTAIPMLLGVFKIIVDMILMIVVFTSSISNVVNGGA